MDGGKSAAQFQCSWRRSSAGLVTVDLAKKNRLLALYHTKQCSTLCACAIRFQEGKSFKILNPQVFSTVVLPKYFRHAKLTSLQRQLNLYGFTHVTKGAVAGSYVHPLFQRGQVQNLELIKRPSRKADKSAAAAAAASGMVGSMVGSDGMPMF